MTEPTPTQKMLANIRALRKQGAPEERIKQTIAFWAPQIQAQSAEERKLSGLEQVGGFASKMGSGTTFGTLDEAVGVFSEDAKNEQRFLQKQFSEEHPALAFGAEVLGSLAMPGTIFKQAPRAAGLLRKGATIVGEGMAQGALAGAGNAEGGLAERAVGAGKGAGWGGVTAGAIGGAAKAGSRAAGNITDRFGVRAPDPQRTLERMADQTPADDIGAARARLSELSARRLGDEAMVADVLPQGEGALRQAATANREVRKGVDVELRERMNRLANMAADRFSEYTGTQPKSAAKSVEELNTEAAERARPLYQAAQEEAGAAPAVQRLSGEQRAALTAQGVPADKLPPMDVVDEALALPYVQQRIGQLRAAPRSKWTRVADDDHALLDEVYKSIGRKIRSLDKKDWELKDDLIAQRAVLKEAIASRAPSYPKALEEFADPMGRLDAFKKGTERSPADIIPSEMKGMDQAEQSMFREGKASLLRQDVPNLDVGAFARFQDVLAPVATREKAQVFKTTFREKAYNEYVRDLLEMAGLQRMKAGAGESTTVDKLMEQIQAEPEAIVGMVAQVLRGNPMAAVAQFSPANAIGRMLDRLRASGSAKQNAEFLTQRGPDKVQAALDLLEKLRAEGKLPRPRGWKRPEGGYRSNAAAASARIVGSMAGRS